MQRNITFSSQHLTLVGDPFHFVIFCLLQTSSLGIQNNNTVLLEMTLHQNKRRLHKIVVFVMRWKTDLSKWKYFYDMFCRRGITSETFSGRRACSCSRLKTWQLALHTRKQLSMRQGTLASHIRYLASISDQSLLVSYISKAFLKILHIEYNIVSDPVYTIHKLLCGIYDWI